MTALAPCPGCERADRARVFAGNGYYRARCVCGWCAPTADSASEATAAWNHRAPALSAELQELRTLICDANAMLRRVRSYRGYVGGPLCELWTLDVMRRLRDAAGEKP